MTSRALSVVITGDAKGAQGAFNEVAKGAEGLTAKLENVGQSLTKAGKALTLGVTAPIAAFAAMGFAELADAGKVTAQTEAALRSTGGAANVTAKEIDNLGNSILRKSGIDDEAVKSGANMLLTFTKIRNEAGKGNDIFNQATKAAVDLSVAFGKDVTESAILVGKALNDPIAGVTALRRVGVQLTDAQKDQIQAFVDTGDVMSAQKVILAELTTEVGGSANAYGKTMAGQVAKAREELRNAAADMVTVAAPAVRKLADVVMDAAHWLSSLPTGAKEAIVVMGGLAAATGPVLYIVGNLVKVGSGLIKFVDAAGTAMQLGAVRALEFAESLKVIGAAQLIAGGAITIGLVAVGALIVALSAGAGKYERITEASEKWGRQTVLSAKASGDELKTLQDTARILATRANDLKGAFIDTNDSAQLAAAGGLKNANDANERLSESILVLETRHKALTPEIARLKDQQALAEAAEKAREKGLQDLATGTTDFTTATDDALQAVQALQSAVLAQAGGEIGLQQALLNVNKAETDLTAARTDGKSTADEIHEKELALQQARLAVASATLGLMDDTNNLNTLVRDPAAYDAAIRKLEDAKAKYGDTTGTIQEMIDRLVGLHNSLSAVTNRSWDVYVSTIFKDANEAANQGLYYAKGGMVYAARGRFIPRGTDTVPAMLSPGEYVLDAGTVDRIKQGRPSAGGSSASWSASDAGGPRVVHVHVDMNGREVARAVWDEDTERDRRRGR